MNTPTPSRTRTVGARWLCLIALAATLTGCAGYRFEFANTATTMDPVQRALISEIYVH
jgi:hypothetical protein